MKKFRFLIVFGISLVFCFLLTAGVLGQDDIPTVTLPISNLLEVRKDLIRKEGNAFPGGWSEYFVDYKTKTRHLFYGEEARPFDLVLVFPYTLEMCWVQILMLQDQNFESDEWAEKYYRDLGNPRILSFQIFLRSDSLNRLAKDDLRFVYQDSTGSKIDGDVIFYKVKEVTRIDVAILVTSNPQDITWFSLHILNKYIAGRVDMRWDFRKD